MLTPLLLAATLSGPALDGQLALSPAAVQLSGKAGQTTTQRLTLRNGSSRPLHFVLEAQDVVVRDGRRVFVPAGELPGSIAATAVFSERAVTVPPGASRTVGVTVTVPPGAASRAVVALFRGTTRLGDARAAATASLGALLVFRLSDALSLAGAELRARPQTASTNTALEEELVNDGAEPVSARGVAVILDGAGAIAARVPFEPRRLLPGERILLRAEHPGELAPGSYRALATFDYEGRSLTRTAALVVP